MSGGRFDYADQNLTTKMFGWHIDSQYGMGDSDYKSTIKRVRKQNTFEDKLISELIYDVMCLIHSYDWYVCDDTGEETYRADVNFFKKKWLNLCDEKRIRELIDEELAETKEELLKALVVNE